MSLRLAGWTLPSMLIQTSSLVSWRTVCFHICLRGPCLLAFIVVCCLTDRHVAGPACCCTKEEVDLMPALTMELCVVWISGLQRCTLACIVLDVSLRRLLWCVRSDALSPVHWPCCSSHYQTLLVLPVASLSPSPLSSSEHSLRSIFPEIRRWVLWYMLSYCMLALPPASSPHAVLSTRQHSLRPIYPAARPRLLWYML